MAITPKQAKTKHAETLQGRIDQGEKLIDKGLAKGGRTFSVSLIHAEVISSVIKLYQAQGWKVNLVSDQRDGNYLLFKEPNE